MPNQNPTNLRPASQSPIGAIPAPLYIQSIISRSPWDTATRSVLSKKGGIIIDNWSPGENDQLWVFAADNSIRPYDDSSLVLTSMSTSTTSCTQLTLEAAGSALTSAQIWYQGNYQLWVQVEIEGNPTNLYLNLYNADTTPGNKVITYGVSSGPNENWCQFPMTLLQSFQNNFYLQTALSGFRDSGANPYVLTTNSSGVVIDQLCPGDASQIWTLNGDGSIRPVNNSSLVLTSNTTDPTSGSQVTLESLGDANPPLSSAQIWYQGGDQLWVDIDTVDESCQLYLNVNGDSEAADTEVLTYAQTNGTNETWYLIPAEPILGGEWFYLKAQIPTGSAGNSMYVMAITEAPLQAGAQVTIQSWTPGAASQLWQMQEGGIIVNALNLELCLASTSSGHKVTMQNIGDSDYWTNWYLTANNMLGTGSSGSVFFLDVSGTDAAGDEVITSDYSGNNEGWLPLPYEPEGLWFTIENSAAQNNLLSSLLTVGIAGNITNAPPMGGLRTPTLQGAKYQLWRKTIDGYILSATHPNLALTADTAGSLSLALLEAGNQCQQWYTGYSTPEKEGSSSKDNALVGTLENLGCTMILSNTGLVSVPSSGTYSSEELWSIIPYAMPFGESTTIRNLGGGVAGLFMTLAEPSSPGGVYQIIVDAIPEDPAFSTWQYQYPGYIVSAVNPEIVLSLQADESGTVENPQYLSNVVAYPRQPGAQLFQLWTVTNDGQIINQYNYDALAIGSAALKSAVVTNSVALGTDVQSGNQAWDFSVGKALQTVMAQPRVPYPTFTQNGQPDAYKAICKQLRVNDLRLQYVNLAAPLAIYVAQMNQMLLGLDGTTLPSGTSAVDFKAVIAQLTNEITAVSATQALFQQATTLYLSLSQAQALTLSELITACELPNGLKTKVSTPKKKKSWIGDLVEGILYTAMNVAGSFVDDPEAGKEASLMSKVVKNGLPCFANIMATAFDTYWGFGTTGSTHEKALQKAEQDAYDYLISVAELEQTLLNEFEAVGTALGQVETFILSDWGKTQAVYEMSSNPEGMSSLFWPSTMTAQDVSQMLSKYTIGVLQTLIPANSGYSIQATMHTNFQANQSTGLQKTGTNFTFIENNDDGTQNVYVTNNIPEGVMDIIWSCGTNPISFFRGINGWHVPYSYQGIFDATSDNTPTVASVILTVENRTGIALGLELQLVLLVTSTYEQNGPSVSYPIAPYGTRQFAGGIVPYKQLGGDYQPSSIWTRTSPGVIITVGGTNMITFNVNDSYNGSYYKSESDIPACTYTFTNMVVNDAYSCVIIQRTTSSYMVFVDIIITAG